MDSNIYSTPEANVEKDTVFCRECGEKIAKTAVSCPQCSATQNLGGKSKVAAGLLAIFIGGFGIHRFYLGQWWGIFYLLFFWTWIPGIISLVEGIVFLCTSEQSWTKKYGNTKGASALVLVLVSVLVIIPVIGIVAAIALPAYQDYVHRAEMLQQ
ncbi:TM2 domain-containing protein [Amphritea atlantica]|uniref:TM2 domain-containing protein n=1 Tax=Amphritea atlantica TaxID=355243 RepID=A0A1H9GQM6_9GAMM|nr:TM2 domain-containing protein [Amphritea atlantica]SEQ52392.1 TM2 domain-containing protein [Amphritea atlantica]